MVGPIWKLRWGDEFKFSEWKGMKPYAIDCHSNYSNCMYSNHSNYSICFLLLDYTSLVRLLLLLLLMMMIRHD